MAIDIRRRKQTLETLALYHPDGTLAETIEVNQDPNRLVPIINKGINAIISAEQTMKAADTIEDQGNALEQMGAATVQLIAIIFGEEQTARILAFYDGNWSEMAEDLIPVLQQQIVPSIQKQAAENRARIAQQYKPADIKAWRD